MFYVYYIVNFYILFNPGDYFNYCKLIFYFITEIILKQKIKLREFVCFNDVITFLNSVFIKMFSKV